ncbi:MAG: LamG domain-containing protein [Ignavibacteriales bacterium]|nr:LamG domain-containing protein [Ignavibacteriales bacterium]
MKKIFSIILVLFVWQLAFAQEAKMIIHKTTGTDEIKLSDIVDITFSTALVPTDSLIAFWPFNSNANDESGNGHNGTTNGGLTWTSDRFGNPNKAANFNGSDSWIDFGDTHPLITSFSVSLWVKPDIRISSTSNPSLICDAGSYRGFRIYHELDSLRFEAQNYSGWASPGWGISESTLGHWVHIVGTNQNGLVKLYINGSIFKILEGGAGLASTLNLEMGRDTNIDTWYWQGALDDVRIYNKILSEAEVLALYNAQ